MRLRSTKDSNVLIYMTGHGGDNFLKFRDREEISAQEMADCLAQMHAQGRYRELFFMLDTCQASTLFDYVHSPGIITMASSVLGESSYSVSFSFPASLTIKLPVPKSLTSNSRSFKMSLFLYVAAHEASI